MRRGNGPLKKVASFALAGALILAGLPVLALAEAGEASAEVEVVDEAVGDPESGKAEEEALTEEGSPLEDGGQTAPAEPGFEDAAEDVAPDDGLVAEGESDEDALAPQVASGTWGTCKWDISADRVLTVHPGTGEPDTAEGDKRAPWKKYDTEFDTIKMVAEGGKKVVLPSCCDNLFSRLLYLKSVDLSGVDASQVTSMRSMFFYCSMLTSLDLSGWDTSSVTDMYGVFRECSSLASLDLSGWDTSSVTDMGFMFLNCPKLASLDLSGWDLSSVKSMRGLFSQCFGLASLDFSGWDTSHVTDMLGVFAGCRSLTSLDLSSWDTSSATNMNSMFSDCRSLASLDLSGWDTSRVTDMGEMFYECRSLAEVKVGAGYKPVSSEGFPLPLNSADNKWRSAKDGKSYTRDEVVAKRKGVADTYTTPVPEPKPKTFSDVPEGKWYTKVVQRAANLGLIAGTREGTFLPDRNITRGDVAVILWRMAGRPKAGSGAKSFPDVKSGAYYYAAVRWASGAGVVNGNADGTFRPDANVTREQLAVMLSNYARRVGGLEVKGSKADFSSMKDAGKVSSYAQQAVGWCFRNKILSGSNGNVLPQGNATRAQAAKMLVALYDMVNE